MSIFARLRRYKTTPGRDPIEDFTTEAFAAVLDANPELARAWVTHLAQGHWTAAIPPGSRMTWTTQLHVDTGIIDMIGEVEGGPVFVFEHKVWAALRENQIVDYRTAMEARHPNRVRTVLITGRRSGFTQEADVRMTWSDVHDVLHRAGQDGHLVADFLAYLRSEGLGPAAPVSHESLMSWNAGATLLPALETMLQRVQHEADWSEFDPLYEVVGKPMKPPEYQPRRWGRIGLSFDSTWRPGVFIGVMLDGVDHGVAMADPTKGPDFVLVISFHLEDQSGATSWTNYIASPEFGQLRERLRGPGAAGRFHVSDVLDLPEKKRNRWHPFHLRAPLVDVLAGTVTADEQVARFRSAALEAVKVLLAGGELARLRDRLHPQPGTPSTG